MHELTHIHESLVVKRYAIYMGIAMYMPIPLGLTTVFFTRIKCEFGSCLEYLLVSSSQEMKTIAGK